MSLLAPSGFLKFGFVTVSLVLAVSWERALGAKTLLAVSALHLAVGMAPIGLPATNSTGLAAITVALRSLVARPLKALNPQAGGLTLGITDGDTSHLPVSLATELKAMSLTHLTAVSGTNCSIVIAMVLALCAAMGLTRGQRLAAVLAALCGYLLLVGNQPSVVRAAVMSVFAVATVGFGLRVSPVNLLAAAVYLVLALMPGYATSLGFALSVSATAGVLMLAPRLSARLEPFTGGFLALPIAVAISAQLACLPILVTLQGQFNIAGLVANLLAEPAVPAVTVLGVTAATLALVPPLVPISSVAFWLASVPAAYILAVSHVLYTNAPAMAFPAGVSGILAALAILATATLFALKNPGWRPLSWAAGIMALLLIAPNLRPLLPNGAFPGDGWFMVACDVGQGDATVLRGGGQIAVIDVGRDPGPVNRCLTRLGVRHIDLLELTHFDMDHVGGLAGALEGRTVARALLTQFVDSRPGALQAERLLVKLKIPTQKVALGDAGWLGKPENPGSLSWLVLSPHPGGADAQSSNEGSISMFWTNGRFGIFTMADLPAVGQRRLMAERAQWWRDSYSRLPIVLKLSHHGSADQDPDFLDWVHPAITTISVGAGNSYGHPTQRALNWLRNCSLVTLRTDQRGSIAISASADGSLTWAASSAG
ncbi:MAG: ComEC/Rec2 family competence protein [Micrococcales bacterium]